MKDIKTISENLGISKNWQPTESLGIEKGICFETEDKEPENLLGANIEGYYVFMRKADRDCALFSPKMLENLIRDESIFNEIANLSINHHAEGCGLEDLGITDRYLAMEYGWNQAWDKIQEIIGTHSNSDILEEVTGKPSEELIEYI